MNTIDVFLKRKGEFDAQMDLLKAFNLPLSCVGKTQAQLAAVIFDFQIIWILENINSSQTGSWIRRITSMSTQSLVKVVKRRLKKSIWSVR